MTECRHFSQSNLLSSMVGPADLLLDGTYHVRNYRSKSHFQIPNFPKLWLGITSRIQAHSYIFVITKKLTPLLYVEGFCLKFHELLLH